MEGGCYEGEGRIARVLAYSAFLRKEEEGGKERL